jgi:hypothetical protein
VGRKPPGKDYRAELEEAALASIGLKRIDSPHDAATVKRLAERLREPQKDRAFTPKEAVRDPELAAMVWLYVKRALAGGRAVEPELGQAFASILHRVETDQAYLRRLREAAKPKPADKVRQAALCADLLDVGPRQRGESRQDKIAEAFCTTSRTLQRRRAKERGPGKPGRPKKSDT